MSDWDGAYSLGILNKDEVVNQRQAPVPQPTTTGAAPAPAHVPAPKTMRTNISPVAKSVTWVSLGQGSRITSESGEYGLALKSIRSEEPVKEISEDAMAQEIAEFEKMLAARGISQSIYSGGLRRYSGNKFSFTTQSPYFARHSPKGDISSQANKYSYSSRIDKEAGRFEENIHHGHNETSEVTKNDRDVDTSPGQLIGMLSGVQLNPQAEEFIPKTMEDLQIKTILSASLLNTQLHQKTQSSPGSAAKDELANVTSVHAAQDQVQQPVDPTVTNYSGCVFIMQACTSKFPVVEGVYSTLDAAITAAKQCIDRFGEPTVKKFSGDRYNLLAGRGPVARARVFPQELLGTTKAAEIKKVYVSLDIGEEGAITVISAHDTKEDAWGACDKQWRKVAAGKSVEKRARWVDNQGLRHARGEIDGIAHHWYVESHTINTDHGW